MLVLVAAEVDDTDRQVVWMANRLLGMRIFEDGEGKMNLACSDIDGEFLVVSNFTVAGDTQSGRRPSFTRPAGFERGKVLFDSLVSEMRKAHPNIQTGSYGQEMTVRLEHDGPLTLIVETPRG